MSRGSGNGVLEVGTSCPVEWAGTLVGLRIAKLDGLAAGGSRRAAPTRVRSRVPRIDDRTPKAAPQPQLGYLPPLQILANHVSAIKLRDKAYAFRVVPLVCGLDRWRPCRPSVVYVCRTVFAFGSRMSRKSKQDQAMRLWVWWCLKRRRSGCFYQAHECLAGGTVELSSGGRTPLKRQQVAMEAGGKRLCAPLRRRKGESSAASSLDPAGAVWVDGVGSYRIGKPCNRQMVCASRPWGAFAPGDTGSLST